MPDFWRVNSYGYPNPFSDAKNHQEAWDTLCSFYQFRSYSELKGYWESGQATRRIDSHAVESWKATFEEYGLLYVPSGSDQIRITPAGLQFMEAGTQRLEAEFAWIGLNLLLRYPLRGTRRSRRGEHAHSDLLLYWFWHAAMRELNNYLWWSEITNVLCTVFMHDDAEPAVRTVKRLRSRELRIQETSSPVPAARGAFYNSLNQVPNHASLGYLLFDKTNQTSLYDPTRNERRHDIRPQWRYLIDLALGGAVEAGVCESASSFLARMPRAPEFADEMEYFDYAGRVVDVVPEYTSLADTDLRTVRYGQGTVVILGQVRDYNAREDDSLIGPVRTMCRLERGQRVILEEDMSRTYLVLDKERTRHGDIRVSLRAARPITDSRVMERFVE